MPGSVSDSYDPEWSTGERAQRITDALDKLYGKVSDLLGHPKPVYILDLLDRDDLDARVSRDFTIKEWRILRFSLERSKESI